MDNPEGGRVLFVAGCWYPDEASPASGIFIRRHAAAVSRYWQVTVLHTQDVGGMRELPVDAWQRWREVDELRLAVRARGGGTGPGSRFGELRAGFRGSRAYRRRFGEPRLVHLHVIPSAPLWIAIRLSFPTAPLVITEHWSGYQERSGVRLGLARRMATAALLRRAAAVTTVSAHLGEAMRRCGFDLHYQVIPNVVDTDVFHPGQRDDRDEFRFVHVACLRAEKRTTDIIGAVAQLRDEGVAVGLDVVGDGPERQRSEAAARAAGMLGGAVRFRGHLTEPQVAAALRAADALVLFSDFENSPCVIGEALASGIPVVAPRVGGIPEAVPAAAGLLVTPGERQELVQAMRTLAVGQQRFDPAALRLIAQRDLSMDAVGQRFNELYQQLL